MAVTDASRRDSGQRASRRFLTCTDDSADPNLPLSGSGQTAVPRSPRPGVGVWLYTNHVLH